MNKTRILIVGLALFGVASLLSAGAASPIREVVPVEKVVALDAVEHQPALNIALCDFDALKVCATIEREAVSYVASESSTVGLSAGTYAKVSAHGRMCGLSAQALPRSKPLTDYGQRW